MPILTQFFLVAVADLIYAIIIFKLIMYKLKFFILILFSKRIDGDKCFFGKNGRLHYIILFIKSCHLESIWLGWIYAYRALWLLRWNKRYILMSIFPLSFVLTVRMKTEFICMFHITSYIVKNGLNINHHCIMTCQTNYH